MTSQYKLLLSRRFLPFFAAQFLGAFNDNVLKNALIVLITFSATAGSGSDSSILIAMASGLFILPFFISSALAGKIGDKTRKSKLLKQLKLSELGIVVIASVGFIMGSIWLLMFTLFLIGIQAAFFGPIKYGIIPELVNEDEIVAATGLTSAGTFISILLGTITGVMFIRMEPYGSHIISGIIVAVAALGYVASYFCPPTKDGDSSIAIDLHAKENGIGLALATVVIGGLFYLKVPEFIFSLAIIAFIAVAIKRPKLAANTKEVIKHSFKNKEAFRLIILISWFWFLGATFLAQLSVFVKEYLNGDESVIGFLLTCFSIGIALGSLLCNRFLKGEVKPGFSVIGTIGIAASILFLNISIEDLPKMNWDAISIGAFLLRPEFYQSTIFIILISIFGGLHIVPLYAALQKSSKPEERAQTIASNNIINSGMMVLSSIYTIVMVKCGFSINAIFFGVGLTAAGIALWSYKIFHPKTSSETQLGS